MNIEFQNSADTYKDKKLFETEYMIQINKSTYIQQFRDNFKSICNQIVELQKNNQLSEISYIEYTLLYTNVISEKFISEIRCYSEEWYLDKKQLYIDVFDITFILNKYKELKEILLSEQKKYTAKISIEEITQYLISVLPDFYSYLVTICRLGILACVEEEYFKKIKKADEFEINVGEYLAHTEAIYKENKNKNAKELKEWFKERLEYEYAFEDFTNMDFSKEDLSEIDFRYSDLRNSNLSYVNFKNAMLYGTRFCNANMKYANISYASIYEADFTNTDLQGAVFEHAEGEAGIVEEEWVQPGFMGISFKNANLEEADFTKSNLIGADFAGAIMTRAKFNKEHVAKLNLSKEQYQSLHIIS